MSNIDPENRGRLQLTCTQLWGLGKVWAWPCAYPGASSSDLPTAGTQVWIGFEQGDEDHPVWLGILTGAYS